MAIATTKQVPGCQQCGSRCLTLMGSYGDTDRYECDDCGHVEDWYDGKPNPLGPDRAECPACHDSGTVDLPRGDEIQEYPCPCCHPWISPPFPGLVGEILAASQGEPARYVRGRR